MHVSTNAVTLLGSGASNVSVPTILNSATYDAQIDTGRLKGVEFDAKSFSIPFARPIPLSASGLSPSPKRTTVVRRSHPFSSRTMLQIHEDRERKGTSFTFPLAFLSIPLYLFLCHFSLYSAFSCWWHF